jgi:D-aspartate ligase
MRKAIVLGESYGALAVTKALGKEGIQIILLASEPRGNDHVCYSRFVSKRVMIPNPMDDSDRLLNLLMETREDWDGALLIPTNDEYIIFLSQNRTELKKRYIPAVEDWEVTKGIINKDMLYPHAQKIGVPTPQVFFPDSVEFLNVRRDDFSYPCILKPIESHIFDRVYGIKNFMIHDFHELVDKFIQCQKNGLKVMVSEIIPGDDSAIFSYRSYIDNHGDVLAEMCTQKMRQYPPIFGRGSVVRTIAMNREICHLALSLLRSFSYRGFSSTEFKLDHRDHQYKLMEINLRPVATSWLFIAAGINFPYITYLDLVENVRIPPPTYIQELCWINHHWEIVNFVEFLKSGNLNLGKFFEPYGKKKTFPVSFSDDPLHFTMETYFTGIKALKRLKRLII